MVYPDLLEFSVIQQYLAPSQLSRVVCIFCGSRAGGIGLLPGRTTARLVFAAPLLRNRRLVTALGIAYLPFLLPFSGFSGNELQETHDQEHCSPPSIDDRCRSCRANYFAGCSQQ